MIDSSTEDIASGATPADIDQEIYDRSVPHAANAILNGNAGEEPFCHFHATNILPEDVYQTLLNNLPDKEHYTPLNMKVWVDAEGNSTRDRLPMTDDAMAVMPEDKLRIWKTFRAILSSDEVRLAAFRKLSRDITERFETTVDELDQLEAHPKFVLLKDASSYTIKPHPDGLSRIITMMYYMPSDMSQESLGTSLYIKKPIYQWMSGRYKEVKRFPFVPNSIGAFAVSRNGARTSWHGVETIPANSGTRYSCACQFSPTSGEAALERQAARGKY